MSIILYASLFLLGFLLFPILPILTRPAKWKGPAHFYLWLATRPISRAAIVVSDHNDVIFKQMEFDAIGVEKITLDGETKDFEDPDHALSYWKNIPFALADEVHGVLFDPRHAAVGQRKHDSDRQEESTYLATQEEYDEFGIAKWVKGVFAMPTTHELVDLQMVRELIDGGERAEYGNRVEEFYRISQSHKNDSRKMPDVLKILAGLLGPFILIWILSGQLDTPSPTDAVSFGMLWLFLSLSGPDIRAKLGNFKDWLQSLNWRKIAAVTFWGLVIVGFEALLYVMFGPAQAFLGTMMVLLGFNMIPFFAILTQFSTRISGWFSERFFRLGFGAFEEPVFYWTPKKYVIREFSDIDDCAETKWYNLFGTQVGFSYPPDPESWGPEVIPHKELESRQVQDTDPLVADGGNRDSRLPRKFARTNTMERDIYGAFIPSRLKDNKYYIHTARALERFKGSANGEKSHLRLQEAKEKHGGGNRDDRADKTIAYLTAFCALISFTTGVWIFIL